MGGVPCAKAIIDNGHANVQAISTLHAAVSRALGCMGASILLSTTLQPPIYPTEEMEAEFLNATASYESAVRAAAESLLKVISKIAIYCDPTKERDTGPARTLAPAARSKKSTFNEPFRTEGDI